MKNISVKIACCLLISMFCFVPTQSVLKTKKIMQNLYKFTKNQKRKFWYNQNLSPNQNTVEKLGERCSNIKKNVLSGEILTVVLGVITSEYCGKQDGLVNKELDADAGFFRVISFFCLLNNPIINLCAYYHGYNTGKDLKEIKDYIKEQRS